MALSGAERQRRYREKLKAGGGSFRPLVEEFCTLLAGPGGVLVVDDDETRTAQEEADIWLQEMERGMRQWGDGYEEIERIRNGDTGSLPPRLNEVGRAILERINAVTSQSFNIHQHFFRFIPTSAWRADIFRAGWSNPLQAQMQKI